MVKHNYNILNNIQWNGIEAIRGRGLEANDGMMIPTVN